MSTVTVQGGPPTNEHPEPAQPAPQAPQHLGLLEEVGIPMEPVNPPAVRIEGESVVYAISTQRPNSPEMLAALEELRRRGCVVEVDHESSLTFSIIKITVPQTLLPDEEIIGIRQLAAQQAESVRGAVDAAGRDDAVIDPYASC